MQPDHTHKHTHYSVTPGGFLRCLTQAQWHAGIKTQKSGSALNVYKMNSASPPFFLFLPPILSSQLLFCSLALSAHLLFPPFLCRHFQKDKSFPSLTLINMDPLFRRPKPLFPSPLFSLINPRHVLSFISHPNNTALSFFLSLFDSKVCLFEWQPQKQQPMNNSAFLNPV